MSGGFDRGGRVEHGVGRQIVGCCCGPQVVADRCVARFIVKVAEHDDVGLGIGGEEFVDPLAGDVAALLRNDSSWIARRPVVHKNVQIVAVSLEFGFDDVAGVAGIDVVELRIGEREDGAVVNDGAIDAAFAGRVFVDDFVFAAQAV